MSPQEQALVFECHGDRLLGVLHLPPVSAIHHSTQLAVVNVVGGPQYRVGSHRQFVCSARHLAAAGFPVFRFDYRGMGDSDGEPRGFEEVDEDIEAAMHVVRQRFPGCQIVLMGLCDAASAILMFMDRQPDVAGIIAINPWVRSEAGQAKAYTDHYYGNRFSSLDFWKKLLRLEVNVFAAARDFLSNQFKARVQTDLAAAPEFIGSMRRGFQATAAPVLVALSGADLTAREFESLVASDARWAALMARPQTCIARFETADHTFSTAGDLDAFNVRVSAWLNATLMLQADSRGAVACR